ncbi:hypothetical protein [Nocardiopsis metallicus]|uniref:Uncharacterized protein n=1 Tax=Nocardiopsis metallicus TaxID=179819 RepID=A0A840W678_9ACTN|nr:hypothetical protein [Nocardiopsis metallicus]MBB5491514.1 hypothetical protein [Nocardiopsis metallicus]
MHTLEHPIAQVPGIGPGRLQAALDLPADPQWYMDMVRLDPSPATLRALTQVVGKDTDPAGFDALWMLLAARASQTGFAVSENGLALIPAMMRVQHDRSGTDRDDEVLLESFRRDVATGRRERVLSHIRKRLIEARRLTPRSRGGALLISADRLVRDTYAAVHPARQVRTDFTRFGIGEHYRNQAWHTTLKAESA